MTDFDNFAGQVFSTVTELMGENAVWQKSKLNQVEGKVLFKNPTEPVQIGDLEKHEWRPTQATAEYYEDNFLGLKRKVDAKIPQYMSVRGKKYLITDITSKFDGKTYVAHLEPCKEKAQ